MAVDNRLRFDSRVAQFQSAIENAAVLIQAWTRGLQTRRRTEQQLIAKTQESVQAKIKFLENSVSWMFSNLGLSAYKVRPRQAARRLSTCFKSKLIQAKFRDVVSKVQSRHRAICAHASVVLVMAGKGFVARRAIMEIKEFKEWEKQVYRFRIKRALKTIRRLMKPIIVKMRAKKYVPVLKKKSRLIPRRQKSRSISEAASSRGSVHLEETNIDSFFLREPGFDNEIKNIVEQIGQNESDMSDEELKATYSPVLEEPYESYRLPTLASTRKCKIRIYEGGFMEFWEPPRFKIATVAMTTSTLSGASFMSPTISSRCRTRALTRSSHLSTSRPVTRAAHFLKETIASSNRSQELRSKSQDSKFPRIQSRLRRGNTQSPSNGSEDPQISGLGASFNRGKWRVSPLPRLHTTAARQTTTKLYD
jgi:hypothetical protein